LALGTRAVHSLNRECVAECERSLLHHLSRYLPNHIRVLKRLEAGDLIVNRTVVDAVCGVYLGVRLCNWDCAGDSDAAKAELWERNAVLEKLCVRKVAAVTKQLPCMERMAATQDVECCAKCSDLYGGSCGSSLDDVSKLRDWIEDLRDESDLFPLSRRLFKLCGLIVCRLQCRIHRILRYCTPEAVFLLEELAGTPFVPIQAAMKRRNAYDYWPDKCRELAVSGSQRSLPRPLLLLFLILLSSLSLVA
jgi:hypothetical protein